MSFRSFSSGARIYLLLQAPMCNLYNFRQYILRIDVAEIESFHTIPLVSAIASRCFPVLHFVLTLHSYPFS